PQDHKPDGAAPGERFGAESYAADRGNESFVGSTADEAAEQAAEDSVANLHRHLVGDAVADADEDAEQSPSDGAGPYAAAGEVENDLPQHQPDHAADGTKHRAVAAAAKHPAHRPRGEQALGAADAKADADTEQRPGDEGIADVHI